MVPSARLRKKLRMLVHPGMIGRTLKGKVERHFDAMLVWRCARAIENPEACPAADEWTCGRPLRADGPGAANIVRLSLLRIIFAFAKGMTDGMDGRKIEHVEIHGGDVGQPGFESLNVPCFAGRGRAGARKELIPGGEASVLAADADDKIFCVAGAEGMVGILLVIKVFERGIERNSGGKLLVRCSLRRAANSFRLLGASVFFWHAWRLPQPVWSPPCARRGSPGRHSMRFFMALRQVAKESTQPSTV